MDFDDWDLVGYAVWAQERRARRWLCTFRGFDDAEEFALDHLEDSPGDRVEIIKDDHDVVAKYGPWEDE